MLKQIKGLHHVTLLASSARENNAFFTNVLGLRRVHGTRHLTALFNLSETARELTLFGAAETVGPGEGTLIDRAISLPAHGFLFLESEGAVTVAAGKINQDVPV